MTTRLILAACAFTTMTAAIANADPPERVARISFVSGTTSFRPAAAADWLPTTLNYPITIGDQVWTDRTGRLELQMGATAIDLDAMTSMSVLNLDHHIVQLRLLQGSLIARVRELASDESLEIDTPNSAMTLLRPGLYRIDVDPTGDGTTVTVRRGDAEITAGRAALSVHADQSLTVTGLDAPRQMVIAVPTVNEFEDWVLFRDRRVDTLTTVQYVPRTVVGYEDLDEFGTWRVVAEYGPVWVPHVRAGWTPYRFGHWAWVDPWGWTWIDDAPWGFAPFHYGRWAYVGDGWAWVPGTIVARPVYAPALVAFVGGSNWRIGVNIGAPVGWFPLGPREVFVPTYTASATYVAAMNRPHVTVTNVNVNITNITYINRQVPGAMTVVSRDTFVQARPVAPAAVALAPQAVSSAVVVGHQAPHEFVPVAAARTTVVAPPPTIASRTVVVRTPPPAVVAASVRRAAVTAVVPRPIEPVVTSVQAPRPSPPPAVAVTRVAPDRAAAEITARQNQERTELEGRHAAERAQLIARQAEEQKRAAANAQAQADVRARHAREQADLEARQKREHEQQQQRQDSERRR